MNKHEIISTFPYLPPEKALPLAEPNVEQETSIGILQAMTPYNRFARVCRNGNKKNTLYLILIAIFKSNLIFLFVQSLSCVKWVSLGDDRSDDCGGVDKCQNVVFLKASLCRSRNSELLSPWWSHNDKIFASALIILEHRYIIILEKYPSSMVHRPCIESLKRVLRDLKESACFRAKLFKVICKQKLKLKWRTLFDKWALAIGLEIGIPLNKSFLRTTRVVRAIIQTITREERVTSVIFRVFLLARAHHFVRTDSHLSEGL